MSAWPLITGLRGDALVLERRDLDLDAALFERSAATSSGRSSMPMTSPSAYLILFCAPLRRSTAPGRRTASDLEHHSSWEIYRCGTARGGNLTRRACYVWRRDARLPPRPGASTYRVAVRGECVISLDRDGKRYLDASGGAAVFLFATRCAR